MTSVGSAPPQFHLYLPQMRMSTEVIVQRARAAEGAGFEGIALMDHLAPPSALDQPMYDAMITAAWIAAHTERLTIGHLVLCDAFHHPAVLARQAVTLDHASGGRYELGIGSGSVPAEHRTFGISSGNAAARSARLGETLAVLRALWTGEVVDYDGSFHHLHQARQAPVPTRPIPIIVGGTSNRTMEMVAEYADWWNVAVHQLDQLPGLRSQAGSARVSIQEMIAFVPSADKRQSVTDAANRRFGGWGTGLVIGDADELLAHFNGRIDQGVERFYTWFTDFADPDTLADFGANVIEPMLA